MNLEPIIQSKVSQKNKCCILTYIYIYMESRKKMVLMNLFAGQEWRCRRWEWTWVGVGGGEAEMNGESSVAIQTLLCVRSIAQLGGICCTVQGAQPGAPWQLRGVRQWRGRLTRKGRCIYVHTHTHTHSHTYLWLIHFVVWQEPTQHLKQLSSN